MPALLARQLLTSPKACLLLIDLINNRSGGDPNSVVMLGSSGRRIGVVRSYPRKSQIVREDDPADRVYEVVNGFAPLRCSEKDVGRLLVFISQEISSDRKALNNTALPSRRSPKPRFVSSRNKR